MYVVIDIDDQSVRGVFSTQDKAIANIICDDEDGEGGYSFMKIKAAVEENGGFNNYAVLYCETDPAPFFVAHWNPAYPPLGE